jgi:hypothetical protein
MQISQKQIDQVLRLPLVIVPRDGKPLFYCGFNLAQEFVSEQREIIVTEIIRQGFYENERFVVFVRNPYPPKWRTLPK